MVHRRYDAVHHPCHLSGTGSAGSPRGTWLRVPGELGAKRKPGWHVAASVSCLPRSLVSGLLLAGAHPARLPELQASERT